MKAEIKERIEQIKNGEVPNGYKKTKVGIIPQEWEVEKLGDIGSLIGGGTPSTNKIEYWNGSIPWISSSDLTDESIYKINKTRFITEEAINESATKLIPKNSILIVSRVGVGKVAVSDEILCTSQDFQSLQFEYNNTIFLAYLIKLKMKLFIEFNQGTSIKGVVKSDLENLMIQIPNIQEQTQIALILSTWDIAIEKQEKLIELKKEQKKWLMQELLTGKKRLKGFSGEWKEVRIKNKFKIKNEIVGDRKIKAVAVGVFGIRLREDIFSKELSNDYSKNKVISKNNICFGIGTNEIVYDILFEDKIYCVSPAYKVYEVVGVNPFIIKGILHVKKKEFSKKYMIISARQGKSVDFDGLLNEKIKLPSIEEQKAIAEILITADQEVNLLEKELEAMKEQKKGLMQLLLTGIVRV